MSVTRTRLLALSVPVVALLVLAGQRVMRPSPPVAPREATSAAEVTSVEPEHLQIVVHVSGAVESPGLYRVPEGSRVADLVKRAGGLKPRADLTVVNLAAPLADGEHVIVTRRPLLDPVAAVGVAGLGGAPTGPVHLSTATIDQLDELPGVGPVTAQKIVDWRTEHGPFRSVDDLDQIPGIGPARIEQLRDLVVP